MSSSILLTRPADPLVLGIVLPLIVLGYIIRRLWTYRTWRNAVAHARRLSEESCRPAREILQSLAMATEKAAAIQVDEEDVKEESYYSSFPDLHHIEMTPGEKAQMRADKVIP